MKKILIIVATIVVILALSPIVGSKIIESKLDENIKKLTSSGLEIKKQDTRSGYLNTSKQYKFVVIDSKVFMDYMSELSNKQVSGYAGELLEGTVVGVDLDYSNVPLLRSTSIDIYPVSLNNQIMKDMRVSNPEFAKLVEQFLEKGGLRYHVDYDIITKNFDGYIKDIKESYTQKIDQKVDFELSGSTFSGNGNLIMPKFINSDTKKVYLHYVSGSDEGKFDFENISISSSYESVTSYASNLRLEKLEADVKSNYNNNSKVYVKDMVLSFISTTDGTKAKLGSKSSFKKFDIEAKHESIKMRNFNFDTKIKGIDKDSYEELSELLRDANSLSSRSLNYKTQKIVQELVLRGFELDIDDISIERILINDSNDLGTSSLKADIKLPQNALGKNARPAEMVEKIDVDMLLTISKPTFEIITKSSPIVGISKSFAKSNGDSMVYDVKVKDGSVTVNGKKVK